MNQVIHKLVKSVVKQNYIKVKNVSVIWDNRKKHGFTFENEVRKIFGLETKSNDRNVHDIM